MQNYLCSSALRCMFVNEWKSLHVCMSHVRICKVSVRLNVPRPCPCAHMSHWVLECECACESHSCLARFRARCPPVLLLLSALVPVTEELFFPPSHFLLCTFSKSFPFPPLRLCPNGSESGWNPKEGKDGDANGPRGCVGGSMGRFLHSRLLPAPIDDLCAPHLAPSCFIIYDELYFVPSFALSSDFYKLMWFVQKPVSAQDRGPEWTGRWCHEDTNVSLSLSHSLWWSAGRAHCFWMEGYQQTRCQYRAHRGPGWCCDSLLTWWSFDRHTNSPRETDLKNIDSHKCGCCVSLSTGCFILFLETVVDKRSF